MPTRDAEAFVCPTWKTLAGEACGRNRAGGDGGRGAKFPQLIVQARGRSAFTWPRWTIRQHSDEHAKALTEIFRAARVPAVPFAPYAGPAPKRRKVRLLLAQEFKNPASAGRFPGCPAFRIPTRRSFCEFFEVIRHAPARPPVAGSRSSAISSA